MTGVAFIMGEEGVTGGSTYQKERGDRGSTHMQKEWSDTGSVILERQQGYNMREGKGQQIFIEEDETFNFDEQMRGGRSRIILEF